MPNGSVKRTHKFEGNEELKREGGGGGGREGRERRAKSRRTCLQLVDISVERERA